MGRAPNCWPGPVSPENVPKEVLQRDEVQVHYSVLHWLASCQYLCASKCGH